MLGKKFGWVSLSQEKSQVGFNKKKLGRVRLGLKKKVRFGQVMFEKKSQVGLGQVRKNKLGQVRFRKKTRLGWVRFEKKLGWVRKKSQVWLGLKKSQVGFGKMLGWVRKNKLGCIGKRVRLGSVRCEKKVSFGQV